MNAKWLIMGGLMGALAGCQTFPHDTTQGKTNLMMTDSVSKLTGHGAAVSRFELGQPVMAYLTLYATPETAPKTLDAVWYSNGKKVLTKTFNPTVLRQPHFVWFSVDSATLGVGEGVVNIYADGKPLQSAKFTVVAAQTAQN